MENYLSVSEEIENAIKENLPVVALESTIISHGMPYPKNVETALMVEKTIRENGAIPATIAIINGRLKAGLTKEELELLGKKGTKVIKVSRRDIPVVLAKKMKGATTVASTMIIAEMVGIKVFATGGIGGVHRGASQSMDISADLQELANTQVAVVCAGAKAILDLKLTLEYLETFGVPVFGIGTEEFPAFYSRNSGLKVEYKIDSIETLAEILKIKWDMGLKGGAVIANPIPKDYEMKYAEINLAIEQAILDSQKLGISGKDITPFLLAKIKALTKGKSLEANIQLILNNARLAAQLAKALGD